MARDLHYIPAGELVELFARKLLSPVEAAEAALDRIAALNPRLNAFVLVDEEGALAQARAAEARWQRGEPCGRLDGVPVTLKDQCMVRGWPTRRGSLLSAADQMAPADGPVTARLREHGAVFLGKTTTPENGWKGLTDSPLTGITRNPWNIELHAGGSSGGAASALAAGIGALAVGSDGGGSIRIPASFTGVVGLKPSFGRVPTYPFNANAHLIHFGPMARSIADAALMLNVISEPDIRDWTALPHDRRDWLTGLDHGVQGLRIAYSPTLGFARVDPEVRATLDDAARRFGDFGAIVEGVDPPLDGVRDIFATLWAGGVARGIHGVDDEQRALMDPDLVAFAAYGESIELMDYLAAQVERARIASDMGRFFELFDLLLTPATPVAAFPCEQQLADPEIERWWFDWAPFSYPFNMSHQPAISVPCGLTGDGRPIGLQLVAARFREDLVLRAAAAFEKSRPGLMRPRID
jgi:aspartyl-tRNA(Asn)/glutamyl-tRNA(Gln) amidotransferase subunit A